MLEHWVPNAIGTSSYDSHFDIEVSQLEERPTSEQQQLPPRYRPRYQAHAPVESAVLPEALTQNWFKLSSSRLPLGAFASLISMAIQSEQPRYRRRLPLSSESLATFLDFWDLLVDEAAEPVLGLTPQGEMVAEWFMDPDNCLVIMTHRDGHIYFNLSHEGDPTEGSVRPERADQLVKMLVARNC